MRNVILLIVLVALGAGIWVLLDDDKSEPTDGFEGTASDEDVTDTGARLQGMRADAATDPDATENPGRAVIVGEVRLSGATVPAQVELRVVSRQMGDGAEALFQSLGRAFLQRITDGGVATGGVLAKVSAGADGTFQFRGLGPGMYELLAWDDADRRAGVSVTIPADGARVAATINLPSGDVTLSGRVVFDDGSPFLGTVIVTPAGDQMSPFMPARGPQTQTDAEGYFSIGGLAPGMVVVNAVQPGIVRAVGSPITLPIVGDPFVMTVGAGGLAVSGTVISAVDRTPVPGATVLAGGGGGAGFIIRTTTTDAEGKFTVTVPGTQGGMIIMAAGYAQQMVELRRDRQEQIVVPLQRLGKVSGVLVSKADKTPLAGIPIYAVSTTNMGGFSFPSATRTGPEGQFVLDDVAPGQTMIFAYGYGWVSEGMEQVGARGAGGRMAGALLVAVKAGGEHALDLTAIPAGTVEGHVRTQDGQPVAHAVVALQRSGDALSGIGRMLGMSTGLVTNVTDRDGHYLIDAVVPGSTGHLTVAAVGFGALRTDPFQVGSGERTTMDLTVESARWLIVTVLDAETGKPIPNAIVHGGVKGDESSRLGRGGAEAFTTDASGEARVGPFNEGILGVRVRAVGYLPNKDETWFPETTGTVRGTVRLRPGLRITGHVRLPDGMSPGGVEVTAQSTGRGGWQHVQAAPKADGSFVLLGLREGVFKVTASGILPGSRRFEARLEDIESGASDVELVLVEEEQSSVLVVHVVDAKGMPVVQAAVSFRTTRDDGSHTSTHRRSLTAGRVTLELDDDQPADELWIEITKAVGGEGGALIHGPLPYEGGEVTLTLPAAQSIRGRVTAAGHPVVGVRIAAHVSDNPKGDASEHGTAITTKDGSFTVEGLGDHDYELRFVTPAAYSPIEPMQSRAGATNVQVLLVVGLEARITVKGPKGAPVSGARVTVRVERDKRGARNRSRSARQADQIQATADAQGVALLQGLPRGVKFGLKVEPPAGRDDMRAFEQAAWSPAAETVRLPEAFSISGIARDKAGKVFVTGQVRAKLAAGTGQNYQAEVQPDGRFHIKGLPEGEYSLSYNVQGVLGLRMAFPGSQPTGDASGSRAGTQPTPLRVRVPARNVQLTWDLGPSLEVKITNWPADNRWVQASLTAEPGMGGTRAHAHVSADGRVRFYGLKPDATYTCVVTGLPRGRYVLVENLRAGARATTLIKRGVTIRGRVVLPPAAEGARVNVNLNGPGGGIGGAMKSGGRFEIAGVPPGAWRVQVWAQKDNQRWGGRAETSGGTELVITLEPLGR